MKTYHIMLCASIVLLLQSCIYGSRNDDDGTSPSFESSYRAITIDRAVFEESIALMPARPIENSGKIYIINDLLFLNEKNDGFHLFANNDPSNPEIINFMSVPGSTDIAIRNNIFYINQAVDLIAVRFDSATNEVTVEKRVRNVFPELLSPDGFYATNLPENHIVIDWELIN